MTATVVLVHGAFHGGVYWRATLKGLVDLWIPAIDTDLPGHGEDTRPLADLHGDADAVREVVDSVTGSVVLVGHSYGGAVITDAGVHPSVEHVVCIAGYLLAEGETVATAGADLVGIDHSGRPRLSAALRIDENGVGAIADADAARRVFYSDFDDEQVAEILTMTSPQRTDSFAQHPRQYATREKVSTYVVCTQDMTVHPDLQRGLALRSTQAAVWDCGHFPMVTEADRTVRFLAAIAEQY